MKRDQSSSNEDEVSGIKDSDSDAKRPRIAENNDDDDVVLSSPRRSSSSSNLRRSSRISQRIEKVGSTGSTVKLNNGDASIFVDNSKGQRRRGTGRMLQKFLMGHTAGSSQKPYLVKTLKEVLQLQIKFPPSLHQPCKRCPNQCKRS